MDVHLWNFSSDNLHDPLHEFKEELKTVEKQINKVQWRGNRGAPGHLHSRRAYLRQQIAKHEAR